MRTETSPSIRYFNNGVELELVRRPRFCSYEVRFNSPRSCHKQPIDHPLFLERFAASIQRYRQNQAASASPPAHESWSSPRIERLRQAAKRRATSNQGRSVCGDMEQDPVANTRNTCMTLRQGIAGPSGQGPGATSRGTEGQSSVPHGRNQPSLRRRQTSRAAHSSPWQGAQDAVKEPKEGRPGTSGSCAPWLRPVPEFEAPPLTPWPPHPMTKLMWRPVVQTRQQLG
jgi:hypothetical protein